MSKAVYLSIAGGAVVKAAPSTPSPEAGEVLIKNIVVASNPKDWKLAKQWGVFEGIEGNDVAGQIEAVGDGVTDYKKGDHIIAFTPMGKADKFGAYQPFSISPVFSTAPVPSGANIEEAVTLPLAGLTAAVGLFIKLGFPDPSNGSTTATDSRTPILIWGASSSVGSFAVQLAKKAGLKVIGVAGSGAALAKSLGADEVVDYREGNTVDRVRSVAPDVKYVYDAVATQETAASVFELLRGAGGTVTAVLPYPEESVPSNVKFSWTGVGCVHEDQKEFGSRWLRTLVNWVAEGKLKANVVKLIPNGLEGVPHGLKLLEENKVHGEKLVYRISETPV